MARRIVILANPFPPLRLSVVGGATFNSLDSSSGRIREAPSRGGNFSMTKGRESTRAYSRCGIYKSGFSAKQQVFCCNCKQNFCRSSRFTCREVRARDPTPRLCPRLSFLRSPPSLLSVLPHGSNPRFHFSPIADLNKSRPVTPTTLDGWSSLEKNGLSIDSLLTLVVNAFNSSRIMRFHRDIR